MLNYSPPRYLLRRSVILRVLRPAKKFLEVGAGNLKLSSELVKYFDKGVAIDFEKSVSNYYSSLPKSVKNNLAFKTGDFTKVKMDSDFDCVISCEVMEHIKDDGNFLKRIYELTKKGGQVIISVPAKAKYWTVHDEVVGHFRRYEKKDLKSLFQDQGFKDIQIISYGFPFINVLWLLRALHGRLQYQEKQNWTAQERTKASSVRQISKRFDLLGFISNKYVFFLPNQFARLFEKFDWSEGYVVNATK